MKHKKAFMLTMLILALVMLFFGIAFTNNCSRQETLQIEIMSDAVNVPANGTAYKKNRISGI